MDLTPNNDFRQPLQTELWDIQHQNYNWGQLDGTLGCVHCTSTTRPASPKNRQIIYETDTGRTWSWNGTAWVCIAPGGVGGKRYDSANVVLTTLANNTTEQLTGMETGAFNLEANRIYRVTFLVEWDSTVANDRFLFRIRRATLAGTQIGSEQSEAILNIASREHSVVNGLYVTTTAETGTTFLLTSARSAGTGTNRIYKSNSTRPYGLIELVGASGSMASV